MQSADEIKKMWDIERKANIAKKMRGQKVDKTGQQKLAHWHAEALMAEQQAAERANSLANAISSLGKIK